MKTIYIIGICVIALCILGILFFRHREHFFFGKSSVQVSWVPPAYPNQQNLIYSWKTCEMGSTNPSCSGTDPTKWPGNVQTTTDTDVTLDEDTCPKCDFGGKILFAVMATDKVTNLSSGWATTTIDLTSTVSGSPAILDDQTGEPLSVGTVKFSQEVVLGSNVFGSKPLAEAMLQVTRGSTVYETQQPLKLAPVSNSNTTGFVNGTFTDPTIWGATPPGALQGGDVVSYQDLIVGTGKNGPIYYYGGNSITIKASAPPAPSFAGWQAS
jgi:hypothetical protein